MKIPSRLSEFLEFLDRAPSMEELRAGTLTVIGHFRLSVAASGIIAGSKAATPERFHFAHWPPGLLERYMSEDLQALDPIPRWARGTGTPATFSQISKRLRPKDPGQRMIQIAKEYGCVEGICVPMRASDGAIGVISMVGDRSEFSPEEFRDLVAIGSLVFRRAEFINHSADRAQGWHAVSIAANPASCASALALGSARFLSDRAPNLPLPQCSARVPVSVQAPCGSTCQPTSS